MKIIATILILLSLITSAEAVACSVYIKVINSTGTTLKNVKVKGPWSRRSSGHEMKNQSTFTYHATGNAFTCHGEYQLTDASGDPYCDMTRAEDNSFDFKRDGTVCFDISGNAYETSPRKCVIDTYEC